MKNKNQSNEIELDVRGVECPIPVLKARKLSKNLRHGDVVKVICTDPLAEMDFKHYFDQSGYNYIGSTKKQNNFIIRYEIIIKG